MTLGDTLYIVIPAYNEEANLHELVNGWYPMLACAGPKSRLLIINDGSQDKSSALLAELQAARPQLLYRDESNKGHGPSLVQAYQLALEAGADYIFQTDSDNQTSPEDFPDLWLRRRAFPVCAGFRKVREDGKSRVFVSHVLSLFLGLFFRVWVKDANVPFRLYQSVVLEKLVPTLDALNKLPNAILMAETRKLRLAHFYRDIRFAARKKGSNSINPKKIVKIGFNAIAELFSTARRFFKAKQKIKLELEKEGCRFT